MTKRNYDILLAFVLCGCTTDRRLGGEMVDGAGSGGTDATNVIEGTTAHAVGGTGVTGTGSSVRPSGGAEATQTAGGGRTTNTANATGGTSNAGTVHPGTGGTMASAGGATSGPQTSGTATGGTSGGNTSGVLAGGASNGGASIGGASAGSTSCIPVCTLYGAPCCAWETSCLGPTGGCTIDVLDAEVSMSYEYAELEANVAALPQAVSVSLTEQDFAWVAADAWPSGRIELHLTEDAAARYGTILDGARDNRAFRVSCGGKSLFVGVFYLVYGAAAINTPVLHEARENGVLVLRLGAVQGAWMFGPPANCVTPCQRIDRRELRAAFCRQGVMHELDPNARPPAP